MVSPSRRFAGLVPLFSAVLLLGDGVSAASTSAPGIDVSSSSDGGDNSTTTSFALHGNSMSYRFHVYDGDGDLVSDHFGGSADELVEQPPIHEVQGWVNLIGRQRREFPDLGRGDFRTPAVQIQQNEGTTVSALKYVSHEVMAGKPALGGGTLPATFGADEDVSTLVVKLFDNTSSVAADLYYSVFPEYDAVVRSVNITNMGSEEITIDKLASLSVDLPYEDLDMIELRGDWAREATRTRRAVDYGTQGFGSTTGYSSHLHNPFLSIVTPDATETNGEAWGFSLIYTGSFAAEVEKGSQGYTRAMMGLNPLQFSWKLGPGETLTTPECVAVYSDSGIGAMSRKLHRLYSKHLMRSEQWVGKPRPVLLNSWEGLLFDYNQTVIEKLAHETADLGVSLFVLDDGWFGVEYPRTSDDAGLGDWTPNPKRFPNGLAPVVENITQLDVANHTGRKLEFGLWFEPEMVNPNSTLYHKHPDWALHADGYARTLTRNQLVLNVGLPEVQDFIIESVSNILSASPISYVKWDNNRGMHQTLSPRAFHTYMLGLYHVLDVLTTRFPDVLWEGCASGGGRFDAGILHYFPQIWTSDNTDALDRLSIQFGTSLAYPPAVMGAHVSAVPNGNTGRNIPILFRGHVALMGGSFGLELNPEELSDEERSQIPGLVALAEELGPVVQNGDFYRINLPEESNWPAANFVSEGGDKAVLFAFQVRGVVNQAGRPSFRLQGLEPQSRYRVEAYDGQMKEYSGRTLMNVGLQFAFDGDYDSTVMVIERVG